MQPVTLELPHILTLARREAGFFDDMDADLEQRVADFVQWINERGPYTPDQVLAMQRQIQHILASRLHLAADRRRYPGIAKTPVEQPVFVIGFARAGTTLLHALLAQDPQACAPLAWHSRMPSPPPGAGPVCKGRIAYADHDVQSWINLCPGQLILHPYADKGAYQLIEDEELLTLDFRTAYPSLLHRVPTLDVRVVLDGGYGEAVRFHREVVQHLMWNTGKRHWVSKFATAQQDLGALFETYPDALCIWAHRPLSEIYASNVAVRAATYDAINGRPMDWTSQARARAEQMQAAVERMMNSEIIDDPRILHLPFHQLVGDPIGTIEAIYARRGWDVSDEYRQRVGRWLDDPENAVDRYGRYDYSYPPYGLDRKWIEQLFAGYSERFGLRAHQDA
ncbi:sulfotransferase [Mangrovimicrobium sediminis]|uniref:Sulfotransferase n=1 Tax=Mangrovimicrobium sediminis TaxID=2562682 RepID=A0A4Z0LVH3_9GAMM|nr:sulfotransferase [Haliea sp. SAOS-164]TGD71322.1 sulfotransferase [Haliea sp. SAOS-164]